jgi:hypothetical protein
MGEMQKYGLFTDLRLAQRAGRAGHG